MPADPPETSIQRRHTLATLAATDLTRMASDGCTLLVANMGHSVIASCLRAKMPYDPVRPFSYIGQIAESACIVATRTDRPAKDLKQFIEWAEANPGKANSASGGPGSSTDLNGELPNAAAGIDLLHVPCQGSAPPVTGPQRDPKLPDLLTLRKQGAFQYWRRWLYRA